MSEADVPAAAPTSPSFADPPLLEVALAVEFAPLAEFGATVMSDLARRWSGRYPRVQEHPPLPPNMAIDFPASGAGMMVSVGAPQIRLWLLTESEDRLVQVQRDRLIVNWRSSSDEGIYPRYKDSLRPEFENDFEELRLFLRERSLPPPRVISTEVTYVNALSDLYDTDLVGVLRSQVRVPHHLDRPVATRLSQTWNRMVDGAVTSTLTLNVEAQRGGDAMLTLTGRSAVAADAEPSDVLGSLDVCHDDVVASFVELTDEQRHKEWGRTS